MLLHPDAAELLFLAHLRTHQYGRYEVKRWTDPRPTDPRKADGQLWCALVVTQQGVDDAVDLATQRGVRLIAAPMLCFTAQNLAAMAGPSPKIQRFAGHHRHGAGCKAEVMSIPTNHGQGITSRWWEYPDEEDALIAALRWEPETEGEPFAWTRSNDGRRRINGDPSLESSGWGPSTADEYRSWIMSNPSVADGRQDEPRRSRRLVGGQGARLVSDGTSWSSIGTVTDV
jgi:hypothetical protein